MSRRFVVALAAMAALSLAACSSGDGGDDGDASTRTPTTVERPPGPVAELAGPLEGGFGTDLLLMPAEDLATRGWVAEEYTAAGTATSYKAVGELPADGTFVLEPDADADYLTRIVVRRPGQEAEFNGTVLVEWINVSAGLDSDPVWRFSSEEILRTGYAWVGVSAQHIGVEGGPAAVAVEAAPTGGLKANDPGRYGALHHPGDAFAYDIYTQVTRALQADGASGVLGDLVPERFVAVGESQAAFALTTYINGVQPLTRAFDGFFLQSRFGGAMPLGEPGEGVSMATAVGGRPAQLRIDGGVPILVMETESDVIGILDYYSARQPDAENFRLWEVAGTAHADAFIVGEVEDTLDCVGDINRGPQRFVARAALRSLVTWVRTGETPPAAVRFEVDETSGSPKFVRDADGIVMGGIRTPLVDVPVATLSGEPAGPGSVICLLLGSTVPLSETILAQLYESPDDYLAAYEEAADEAIDAGFVLQDDRQELLDQAQPDVIPN